MRLSVIATSFLLVAALLPDPNARGAELVSCEKIWDQAPHNAFTSLVRFQDKWFCAFREGSKHVSPDGVIRILVSQDGKTWESAAKIQYDAADLRDPNLSVSPEGQLVLISAAAWHNPPETAGVKETHQTFVWTSPDGMQWTDATPVGDPNYWIWKLTWFGTDAWGMGYGTSLGASAPLRLYCGNNGLNLKKVTEIQPVQTGVRMTESALEFNPDGTLYCLQRQDAQECQGLLGTSRPPYTEWTWKPLGMKIGGPALTRLRDGRLVGVVRLYDPTRTVVGEVSLETGKFSPWLTLPSGGDCSYAGVVEWDGVLWISYYSSHEGKTSIYLAKVTITPPEKAPSGR